MFFFLIVFKKFLILFQTHPIPFDVLCSPRAILPDICDHCDELYDAAFVVLWFLSLFL